MEVKNNSDSFSYSGISMFESCPKAYEYRYIEQLPEAFSTIEGHMGTSVHSALEWLYREKAAGNVPELIALIEQYKEFFWNSGGLEKAKVIKADTNAGVYFDQGKKYLIYYFERVFPGDHSTVVLLEHKFEFRLNAVLKYRGIIDRISKGEDGILQITDYKTGKTSAPLENLQLPSYALFVFENNIDSEIRLCIEDLREERTLTNTLRRSDTGRIRGELLRRISVIRETGVFEARPSLLCHWCGYNHICPHVPDNICIAEGFRSNPCNTSNPGALLGACPQCGGELRERSGKFGRFMGCSNYPHCRYSYNLDGNGQERKVSPQTEGEKICPECGGLLKERSGRYGKFWGCLNYPQCRFTRPVS